MSKFAVGDMLDVSKVYAIYNQAVVEGSFTKKNGSVYLLIRGINSNGSLSAIQHTLWEESAGLTKIGA
jgi:hypothetical protein